MKRFVTRVKKVDYNSAVPCFTVKLSCVMKTPATLSRIDPCLDISPPLSRSVASTNGRPNILS